MLDSQKYYVASGSYYVGKTKPVILQAFLGTCVGLALFDPDAGIGGLIHMLLPEPISHGSSFQPEKYASTGLPLFINALYDAGASREKLKACIAGGSLVGPLSKQDIALDIGGRTTDVTNKILAEEGIKIEKSETGGFFTCCLSLNMQNWETSIEPAGYDKLSEDYEINIPAPEKIICAIDRIQPVPQVALKILRIIDDNTYDIAKIADEVRKDQVISARVLQLCNSAMFATRNRIDSLDHALVYLGQDLLEKLIVSASVENFFIQCPHSMGYSFCRGGLYHHAIGTAIVAEKLADFTGKTEPSMAYTAGLLHDIGKVVLDQYIASGYQQFFLGMRREENILEVEKKILGIDHTQVGSSLARKWSFPEALTDTIKHHHFPENGVFNPELTHIVYLADLLISRFHAGFEMENLNTNALASRLEKIGLSISRFPDIVDLIPTQVFGGSPLASLNKNEIK